MDDLNRGIQLLAATFGGFTKEKTAAYALLLGDADERAVWLAVVNLCKSQKFCPTPAEILEEVDALSMAACGVEKKSASAAWQEALDAVRRYGWAREPKFDDPSVREAVRRFGWQELCAMPVSETGVARAQFRKIYEEVIKDRAVSQRTKTALGIGGPPARAAIRGGGLETIKIQLHEKA